MMQIGLLSDTHGFIDERLFTFFEKCDEIWHAGDIGNIETAEKLTHFRPLKAVYGNIDDNKIRSMYPKIQQFQCMQMNIFITHIGGYPNNYTADILPLLKIQKPGLFISGHSHILKVMFDKKLNFLHINPGAAGNNGFHQVKTAVRFSINESNISSIEIWEAKRG